MRGAVQMKTTLAFLGLEANPKKCVWTPTQELQHLGIVVNTKLGQVAGGSRALLRRRRGLETRATPRWSRGQPRRRTGALLRRAWARPPRLLRVCSRSVATVCFLVLSDYSGATGTVLRRLIDQSSAVVY